MHLWPGKPGQTDKQRFDNLRKALTRHVAHVSEQMAEARADEKSFTDDLNQIADEIIRLCKDNAIDARKCAQESGRAQDYMFSSNAGAHVLNFASKLKPEKDSSKGKAAIIEFIEMEKQKEEQKT